MATLRSILPDVDVYSVQDPQNHVSKDTTGYVRIQRKRNIQEHIYDVRVHLFVPNPDLSEELPTDDRDLVCLRGSLYIPSGKYFHTNVEYTIEYVGIPDADGDSFMVLKLKASNITEYVTMQIMENSRYEHITHSMHSEFLKLPIDLDDEQL